MRITKMILSAVFFIFFILNCIAITEAAPDTKFRLYVNGEQVVKSTDHNLVIQYVASHLGKALTISTSKLTESHASMTPKECNVPSQTNLDIQLEALLFRSEYNYTFTEYLSVAVNEERILDTAYPNQIMQLVTSELPKINKPSFIEIKQKKLIAERCLTSNEKKTRQSSHS